MSKANNWFYQDLYESRSDKLINLLLSEIIFLKRKIKLTDNFESQSCMGIALNKLEYLLNSLKDEDHDLSNEEFDKLILLIYNIFKEITQKIQE